MKKAAFILMVSFCLAAFPTQAEKKVRFFVPDGGWAIEIPFEGFTITDARSSATGDFKATAFHEKDSVYLEIYFERGAPGQDHRKVRSFYESNQELSKFEKADVSRWETDSAAFLVYCAKNVLVGPEGDELNGNMYFCKGSAWVDVRLRKPYPKKGDRKRAEDFLKSLKIEDQFAPTPEDNVFMGNLYCYSGFEDGCFRCLQQAYQAEKQNRKLPREVKISMIENYSNILRIRGERDMAAAVLDYGLACDPEYPMYYWNKARVFAEEGDEEKTVEMIALAVKFRKNILPGNLLPDPRQDDSFKVLGMKESFREKLTTIFFPEKRPPEERGKDANAPKEVK